VLAVLASIAAATLAAGASAEPAKAPAMPPMPPVVTDPAKMPAGHYVSDPLHTFLTARVRHMGLSMPTMKFNKVEATYDYDPARPLTAKVSATIDANSLDYGVPAISSEFAGKFLDAAAHPQITFVSTSLTKTDATHGKMTGDLSFHGTTRPVTLNVTFDGFLPAMGGRAGFSAGGTVKRSAFGPALYPDNVVGDDVQIHLEIEFTKKG
jgi:polyisoprenoid-binding protein YceI